MTQTEVLKAAINHIDRAIDEPNNTMSDGKALKEIMRQLNLAKAALGEALAQPEQEPVAWAFLNGQYAHIVWGKQRPDDEIHTIPLYTSPPASKPWVGLTDGEMRDLEKQFNAERVRTSDEEYLIIYPGDYWAWQRAIEAKLKEKNA